MKWVPNTFLTLVLTVVSAKCLSAYFNFIET